MGGRPTRTKGSRDVTVGVTPRWTQGRIDEATILGMRTPKVMVRAREGGHGKGDYSKRRAGQKTYDLP